MKMKSLLAVMLLALGVTGCSTVKKVVYRIDVPQGNYLEQDKIDQVKVGMNKEQVQYLLGTPVLRDMFAQNRWDYVFIKREGYNDPIQHTLLVYFNEKGLVSDIKLDKPLSDNTAKSE
ncbi:small protein A [Actinobacillus minor NM305]|uniref:Outer membrane protein assembly factor BamE n=1 Tax=Actinobacillus minor NM305 TaxID=637911 RepID=C5S0Z9_9PAST|nr:outer membrane protein assembly factor BamE [Actinobacillus minor]EER47416.1 small protein A [Actinobacillus minor NM305]